jgi:uncharacterized YccA/Bax inhibitor family protein
MARHNVIFGRDQAVQQGSHSGPQFGTSPQGGARGQTQWSSGFEQQGGDQLEAMYARPAATGHDTGRMTMRDALNAITATLGVIIIIGTVVAISPYVLGFVGGETGLQLGLLLTGVATVIGVVGGLVTGLINAFKKVPSAALVLLYALFEGLLLGGISGAMEYVYPGIALQAVTGTLLVAGTVLLFQHLGILRTSPAMNRIIAIAMVAYLIFGLVNIGFLLISGISLREGWVGLAIGGLAIVMASYCLVGDFEDVKASVNGGVPRVYAWRCAFGIAVSMVWLYIEILRIIAILRGND